VIPGRRSVNKFIESRPTLISRQIESTDRQIDELVYEMYGLTKEEMEIVEGEN